MLDRAITAIAVLAVGVAAAGAASADWVGRWGSPNCAPSATVIELTRKRLDLSTFEAACRMTSVRNLSGQYELNGRCTGEERPMAVSFIVRVDGDRLTFLRQRGMDFSPRQFSRCRR